MDGSQPIVGGGYYGYSVDFDGTVRNDHELITRYREMVMQPECDSAVDDIVNETICGNFDDVPVELELTNLKVSDKIKKLMREEFDEILRLLDFENRSYEIFRRWYVDGRLFYHKIIDPKSPRQGLLELRYIDPRKIRKVTEYQQKRPEQLRGEDLNTQLTQKAAEYFLYNPKGLKNSTNQGMKIATDSITYCHSGIQDLNKNMTLSHLHKAIKAVNQLRMIEDSLVIYRLSRALSVEFSTLMLVIFPRIKQNNICVKSWDVIATNLYMMLTRVKLKTIKNSCPCWKTSELLDAREGAGLKLLPFLAGKISVNWKMSNTSKRSSTKL